MQKILDWSEAWAVLIPLTVYVIKRPKQKFIKLIFIYLLIALVINFCADIIEENYYHDPKWIVAINYNLPIYNIHSIIRLLLLMYFFALIQIPKSKKLRFIFFVCAIMFVVTNFSLFSYLTNFSSAIFTAEGFILIVYSIIYFLKRLKSDELTHGFDNSLYIVTGIAIYEAVCFPIFLFYQTLTNETREYAVNIWDVHNIAYIVFCLFIARAFYGTTRRTTQ